VFSKPQLKPDSHYYIGKPCRCCGNTLRYLSNKSCVTCGKGRSRVRWRIDSGKFDEYLNELIDSLPEEKLPPVDSVFSRRLCYGMIQQAVEDMRSDDVELSDGARVWMLSDSTRPMSFRFCCDVLGVDHNVVVDAIMNGLVTRLPELAGE
jgi:hypothetical protein